MGLSLGENTIEPRFPPYYFLLTIVPNGIKL